MKLFLCGQRSFGRAVLKELRERGHEVVGVAPPPQDKYYDKMQGLALKLHIPCVSDCDRLTADDIPAGTDLIVAAHSHWFISMKALGSAKYGGIGFHPSLLPRHRGQDAVRWAVAMGDAITGATVYWLDDKVDGGDILTQRHVFVEHGWNYHRLWKEIFPIGVDMLGDAVDLIARGHAPREPQNSRVATWEPSFTVTRLKRNDLIKLPASE